MQRAVVAFVAAAASAGALATEGGGSIYPTGAESFVCCALPPPGVYGMVYGQAYSAYKVRGNRGQVVTPPTFSVRAYAVAPRIAWVTDTAINASAAEILRRCNGQDSVEALIRALERGFPGADLHADVCTVIDDTHGRGWIR